MAVFQNNGRKVENLKEILGQVVSTKENVTEHAKKINNGQLQVFGEKVLRSFGDAESKLQRAINHHLNVITPQKSGKNSQEEMEARVLLNKSP